MTKQLLRSVNRSYGKVTLLELAAYAGNKEFVGHQACQDLIDEIWWGTMDSFRTKDIMVSIKPPRLIS